MFFNANYRKIERRYSISSQNFQNLNIIRNKFHKHFPKKKKRNIKNFLFAILHEKVSQRHSSNGEG